MAIAGGLSLLAAPAVARPPSSDTVIPSRACHADGPTSADRAVAERLRPLMNGPRLGRFVGADNISCVRAIVRVVQNRGLDQRAAVIAIATAITESSLHNYTRAVDHDSLGLFQQRPSQGWGRSEQLIDPAYATRAFLNSMVRKFPGGSWMTGDVGQICQAVQRSAFPGAYSPEVHDAQLLTTTLWPLVAAEPGGGSEEEADGPFRRALVKPVATALHAADAQQHLTAADWNGDRRADLVVVRRSGTASGRTELYILDGASNFQRLLLNTGTVLGPTDDRHDFSLLDGTGDGKLDLVVVQKSGTASGRTEVRVLDGASFFQRYAAEIVTPLGPSDDRHEFHAADWNADGKPDLVALQRSGARTGRTEVRVLDGATNLQTFLQESVSARGSLGKHHEVTMADWNGDGRLDLVVVEKPAADNRRARVQILDEASGFTKSLLDTEVATTPSGDRSRTIVLDWNGDKRLDLVVMQTAGTASGRGEVRVLSGK